MSDSRKLSRRQKERVRQSQQSRTDRAGGQERDLERQQQAGDLSSEQRGLIVCRYSKQFDVEALEGADKGKVHKCVARTNLGSLVAGDHVIWRAGSTRSGVIESRLTRTSVLERPDNFGRLKAVAANVDQMLIVIAVQPAPQRNLIDRYLVAAELMQIRPVLVLNKLDLIDKQNRSGLDELLGAYKALGYPVIRVISSRHQQPQLEGFDALVDQRTSIIVGQSGVGKSSLINALLPSENLPVGELSTQTGEGTHTTTTARLFHLPQGGQLIDSPGIREFGLWHIDQQQVQHGFVEIAAQLGGCKFRNCEHRSEPGCAVREALRRGDIAPLRFESFCAIRDSILEQRTRGLIPPE